MLSQLILFAAAVAAVPLSTEEDFAHMCIVTSHRNTSYVYGTSAAVLAQLPTGFSMSVVAVDDVELDLPLVRRLQQRAIAAISEIPRSVRQQGLDVAGALELCRAEHPKAQWIVLLEDDFAPCGYGVLRELRRSLLMATSPVKFVRFTQGGGGVAFPRDSVPNYARYVREHDMPHDRALIMPWSDLPDIVLPTHLFKHVGAVSTIAYRNSEAFARQYADIRDNECGTPITV
jgi:hypothetical protein